MRHENAKRQFSGPLVKLGGANFRPTRNAAGMAFTSDRSGHHLDSNALGLSVRGTLDRLSSWKLKITAKRVSCVCCHGPMRVYALSDSGRMQLRALRQKRGAK